MAARGLAAMTDCLLFSWLYKKQLSKVPVKVSSIPKFLPRLGELRRYSILTPTQSPPTTSASSQTNRPCRSRSRAMASLTAANASAMLVAGMCSLPKVASPVASTRFVNMASAAHLRGPRLQILTAARSSSVRPSLFVIRAEDSGADVADKSTRSSPDVGNDAQSFFSTAAKDLKGNVQNAAETVKDKAGELADQAKSVGDDFGVKANEATNLAAGAVEETKDRFQQQASNLGTEARNAGKDVQAGADNAASSAQSGLEDATDNVEGSARDAARSAQSGLDDVSARAKSGLDEASRKTEKAADNVQTRS
ncbi:hypothetical protein MPTK1_2g26370 [Marchantia polymorpha subsp. ruderalis]|nr:hypothetical protein MARPO_0025s0047 [Marchantia polymorpha]BBN03782.1 hypothetical protein Mp_2g26370 [Marchantia polymorpha subsp. ruderalis]|eukprot:PTQ43353.1 hypothetical protein MARPO_0025s0047 [Marchantia polymorpha]